MGLAYKRLTIGCEPKCQRGTGVSIFDSAPHSAADALPDGAAISFVSYLLETYGAGALRTFFSRYDRERRDQAALEAFHRPLGTLEEQWLAHLQREDTGRGDFRALVRAVLPLFKPYRLQQLELFGYMLLGLGYSLAMPLASKYLIDNVIPSGSVGTLVVFVVVLFAIYFLNLLVGMRQTWLSTWVNSRILMGLQEKNVRPLAEPASQLLFASEDGRYHDPRV